ncbi:unnamed protein product [Camellia sinensis]
MLRRPGQSRTLVYQFKRKVLRQSTSFLALPVYFSFSAMTTTFEATNTKCSSTCVADLIPHSPHKPYISKPIFNCFSKRSLPLPLTSKQVGSRKITKGGSITVSMSSSSNNHSESSDSSSGGGLTYKDAGVDIDAGSELVRRIAKMAPVIGGFGGLFPLGLLNEVGCLLSIY